MRGTFKVAGGTSAASAGTDHVENQGLGAGVGRGEPVGVGGGVRRGGGVGRAAVVGLDLGVGVALGIGVAVDVGVAVAVPAGVSVALGVAVAVGVTVAVATRSHREPRCGNRDHRSRLQPITGHSSRITWESGLTAEAAEWDEVLMLGWVLLLESALE